MRRLVALTTALSLLVPAPGRAGSDTAAQAEQMSRLLEAARSKPQAFSPDTLEEMERALQKLKAGNPGAAKPHIVRAIEVTACLVPGTEPVSASIPVSYPIRENDPPRTALMKLLANTQPALLKKIVAAQIRGKREQLLGGVAVQAAIRDFERRFRESEPKEPRRPADPSEVRRASDEAVIAIQNEVVDTPQQARERNGSGPGSVSNRIKQAERVAREYAHSGYAQQMKQYERDLAKYRNDHAWWKANVASKHDPHIKEIQAMSYAQLAGMKAVREEINRLRRYGLESISSEISALASSVETASSPTMALELATSKAPVLIDVYANNWKNQLEDFPDQKDRARTFAQTIAGMTRTFGHQARSGSLKDSPKDYVQAKFPDDEGHLRSLPDLSRSFDEEALREMNDRTFWFAVEAVGAAAFAVGTLGTGTGFAVARMLGLGLSGASLVNSFAQAPGSGLGKLAANPELALQALLFALALGPAFKGVLTATRLPALLTRITGSAAKSRQLMNVLKALESSGVLGTAIRGADRAKNLYFTFGALQNGMLAASSCGQKDDRDPIPCASRVLVSLLNLLPDGIDTYRRMKSGCNSGCKQATDATEPRSPTAKKNQEDILAALKKEADGEPANSKTSAKSDTPEAGYAKADTPERMLSTLERSDNPSFVQAFLRFPKTVRERISALFAKLRGKVSREKAEKAVIGCSR